MTIFVIVGVLMTITAGVFFSLMFTSGMKSGLKKNIVSIILAVAIGLGISGLLCLEHAGDVANWNNGYCECGGEWKLIDVEHLRNSGELYYHGCDTCGYVIKLHSNFTK